MDLGWDVSGEDLLRSAADVALDEHRVWKENEFSDNNPKAFPIIEKYWSSVTSIHNARSHSRYHSKDKYKDKCKEPAWSAAFISYCLLRGYLNLAPVDADLNALAVWLGDQDELWDRTPKKAAKKARKRLLDYAAESLKILGLFSVANNHITYLNLSATGTGEMLSSRTTPIAIGDLVFNGRKRKSYHLKPDKDGRMLLHSKRSKKPLDSGPGHVDIVVGFTEISGTSVAMLIGGNTLRTSDHVGMKYRVINEDGILQHSIDPEALIENQTLTEEAFARLNQVTKKLIMKKNKSGYFEVMFGEPPFPDSSPIVFGDNNILGGEWATQFQLIENMEAIFRY